MNFVHLFVEYYMKIEKKNEIYIYYVRVPRHMVKWKKQDTKCYGQRGLVFLTLTFHITCIICGY